MGNKIKFGKRKHRGALQDSLDTSVEIYEEEFKNLIRDKNNGYNYYCFDNRCNQILFLGKYELDYMWLYIQLPKDIEFDAINRIVEHYEIIHNKKSK